MTADREATPRGDDARADPLVPRHGERHGLPGRPAWWEVVVVAVVVVAFVVFLIWRIDANPVH